MKPYKTLHLYDGYARLAAAVCASSGQALLKARKRLEKNPEDEEARATYYQESQFWRGNNPFKKYLESKGHEFDLGKLIDEP